ncbi:cell wall hydrolase [Sphingomonas lenta]|uniref:cell wall hydrolase n=1 Tax=Sphingomonas lenta TaxID=1141887 RepID=UPI001FE5F629|nr:cell wall hydrolase [Sphingomonas lenta]
MAAGLLLLPAAAGVSAASAWLAVRTAPLPPMPNSVVPIPVKVAAADVPQQGVEPGQELAAPAAGVTGTVALAAAPVLAEAAAETSTAPAAPFVTGVASSLDRARALECLTAAIYYEAASEPDAGQRAVAQVVLNRVRHPAFPATVCGVVYQGSERRGCQFSFACDGSMARIPSRTAWARAARNAAAALAGGVYAPVGLATHYHTFAVKPAWNRSLVMTDVVGAHFFHRWKGWWGTSAAFRQAYRGGEPTPGPHASIPSAQPVAVAAAVVPPPPPPGVLEKPLAPVAVASAAPVAATPADDLLPPASEVLDRWKDSGKPLR